MGRIDFWLLGYRKIKVEREKLSTVSFILLRSSINSHINNDGTVSVRERDFEKCVKAIENCTEYEASDTLGLYGAYKSVNHKPTIVITSIISLLTIIVLSSFVWDIRVEGETEASEEFVEAALQDSGFYIGKIWALCDLGKIETELLSSNPRFSWININRRGTVAYVVVSDNKNPEDDTYTPNGYANIVAADDCVIEEIRVVRGKAMVKKGDVVKAGDLLICGIESSENSGELCYAEGEVIGRMLDTVSVFVGRNYEKNTVASEKLVNADVKIFNFPINIFKRYGKSTTECDIIENVKVFSLFGKCLLPIKIISRYERSCEKECAVYTDTELVMLASSRLSAALIKRVVGADLVKIRSSGSFVDNGYTMTSEIEFLGSVGSVSPFYAE